MRPPLTLQYRRQNRRIRGLALAVGLGTMVLLAFAQRVVWSYETVFTDDGVLFRGNDAWYHARLIEHQAVGREPLLLHDPYLLMPKGDRVAVAPLFDQLGGGLARLALGFRKADPDSEADLKTVRTAAAFLPAILGSLIILPVFLLAHTLWGPVAAWTASLGFLAVPGQLLSRSLLGATDHHVAEVLFSTTTLALLIVATSASSSRSGPWQKTVLAASAGIALACYQLSWIAGILLPLTLVVWLLASGLLGPLSALLTSSAAPTQKAPLRQPYGKVALAAAVATLLVLVNADGVRVSRSNSTVGGLLLLVAITLWVVSRWRTSLGPRPLPRIALLVSALIAIGLAGWLSLGPFGFWDSIRHYAAFVTPRGEANTVREATPLLLTGSGWGPLWRELGMGWLIALPGLLVVAWKAFKHRSNGDLLVLVWAAVVLLLTLSQNRFAYYLGILSVLVAGALVASLLSENSDAQPPSAPTRRNMAIALLAGLGVSVLFIGPNLRTTKARMNEPASISTAWLETLDWLRTESPDPFAGRDCYFASREYQPGECESEYGVFSWWDPGYWIIQRAHRVPYTNPTQVGAGAAAKLLLSSEPGKVLDSLRQQHARYLVIDATLSILQPAPRLPIGKFPAIAVWAGQPDRRFFETVLVADEQGNTRFAMLFYQDFFETLLQRLVVNGGQAVVPEQVPVFELEERTAGLRFVRSVHFFNQYLDALAFIQERPPSEGTDWRIASFESLASPVPLEQIDWIKRSFHSSAVLARNGDHDVPFIQVFELQPIDSKHSIEAASADSPGL